MSRPVPCGAGRLRCVCWAGLLDAPVGGGPPARRPRCELRSARRLEARPGPATAHGHRSLALPPPTGTAARPCRRPRVPQPGPPVPPAPSTPVEPGVLMIGSARRLEARPGPAAAHRHRGQALLWSLRHYANPSNDKRPGPQPHNKSSTTCAYAQWCNACPCGGVRIRGWACWCGRCTRSVGIAPVLNGCSAT